MKRKQIKVAYTNRKTSSAWTTVPKIQIEGSWLEELGFHVGDQIAVEYDETGIRIRSLTQAEQIEQKQRELSKSFRKRTRELKKLQTEAAKEISRLAMVAEPTTSYKVSR